MPRPDATPAFIAAIQQPYVKPAIFVQIHFTTETVSIWTGAGSIFWGGSLWQGVGQFGEISTVEEGANIQARGITLTLSGIDTRLLNDTLNGYQVGLPVVVYLGLFDAVGNLIPNPITSWAGRTDQPTITVSGDSATISIACENRLLDMNVSVESRYNDADQKRDYPNDLGFQFVQGIQSITLYFGRHPTNSNTQFSQGTG